MASRRTIQRQAQRQNEDLRNRGVRGSAGLDPSAGRTITDPNSIERRAGIFATDDTPDQSRSFRESQLANATNLSGINTPSQRTQETRQAADAPLRDPRSGVRGAGTGFGFSPVGVQGGRQIDLFQPTEITARTQAGRELQQSVNERRAARQSRDPFSAVTDSPQEIQRQAEQARQRLREQAQQEDFKQEQLTNLPNQYADVINRFDIDLNAEDPFATLRNEAGAIDFDRISERIFNEAASKEEAALRENQIRELIDNYEKIQAGEFIPSEDMSLIQDLEEEAAAAAEDERQRVQQEQFDLGERFRRESDTAGQTAISQERQREMGIDETAIQQVIGALPAGSEWMAPVLQSAFNTAQQNEALAGMAFGSNVGRAEQQFNDVNSIIGAAQGRAQSIFNASDTILKESRDRQLKQIAEEKQLADEQLLFEQQRITRQQKKNLSEEIDRRTAALALSGGFGSSNGLDDVARARAEGENAILEMQAEIGFKRRDVALQYTQLANQAEETYSINMLGELNNLESRLANLDLQQITSIEAKNNAINSEMDNFVSRVTGYRKDKANALADAADVVNSAIAEEKQIARQKQTDATSLLNSTLQNYGGLSSSQAGAFRRIFSEAGLDPNLISEGPTVSKINSQNSESAGFDLANVYGQFTDDTTGIDYGMALYNATSKSSSKDQQASDRRSGLFLLESGNTQAYKTLVRNAALNGMDSPIRTTVLNNETIISSVDNALQSITGFSEEDKNLWNSFGQKIKDGVKKLNSQEKKEYNELKSRLDSGEVLDDISLGRWENLNTVVRRKAGLANDENYLRLVSQIAAPMIKYRKELFGAALTETELASAQQILPDPTSERIEDVKTKLQEMSNSLKDTNRTYYNQRIGYESAYDTLISNQGQLNQAVDWNQRFAPTPSQSTEMEDNPSTGLKTLVPRLQQIQTELSGSGDLATNKNLSVDDLLSLMPQNRVTQHFNSVLDPSIYPESTIKAWGGTHKGLDIAVPVNTPIPAMRGGTIKRISGSADDTTEYGLNVVWEDDDGLEWRVAHLNSLPDGISVGSRVDAGDVIAFSGNSGLSTGPHIDLRVKKNGRYINPTTV